VSPASVGGPAAVPAVIGLLIDVPAYHVLRGVQVLVATIDDWITLADPAGDLFCLVPG
jgi:hypothetical protein